jgi:hypothetical protein
MDAEIADCPVCGIPGPVTDWDDNPDGGGPIVECAACIAHRAAVRAVSDARVNLGSWREVPSGRGLPWVRRRIQAAMAELSAADRLLRDVQAAEELDAATRQKEAAE